MTLIDRRLRIVLFLLLVPYVSVDAVGACRVLDPELQGTYRGGCRNGLADGEGVIDGHISYTGGFRDGRKHGQGVKIWPNGDRYEGGFEGDARHGVGTYTWGKDSPWYGERYHGGYDKDRRSGFGVYEWPNGDRYAGPWRDDGMVGQITPMQMQQLRYHRAVVAALSEAGRRICRIVAPGKVTQFSWRGEVVGFADDKVTVRISGPADVDNPPHESMPSGTLLTEPGVNWVPCY